jgi:hypothetical protein
VSSARTGSSPTDRFADHDVGLEMSIPHGWTAAATEDFPLVLLAPEDHGFRANVGVRPGVLDPPTPETFEELVQRTKAVRQDQLPEFVVVAERVGPQAGCPGWQLRATWEDGGLQLTQITQIFVAEPARLFEVTATCLKTVEQEYLPFFRQILDSWVILPDDEGTATEAG